MAELSQILNDGEVGIINAGQELQQQGQPLPDPAATAVAIQQSADNAVSVAELQAALADGISLPAIAATDAGLNTVFFNNDIDRVCWKSQGGLVFKFNMVLT